MSSIQAPCWCCASQIQTQIEGTLKGKRATEILQVTSCAQKNCPQRHENNCLIGKEVETHWQ